MGQTQSRNELISLRALRAGRRCGADATEPAFTLDMQEPGMVREPIGNDAENPLVSVLVYDYHGEYLAKCFDSIFGQTVLSNIEVIFIDNASTDGSWNIALEYAKRFPGAMTIKRNRRGGEKNTRKHGLHMAHGKYCVPLCEDEAFLPEYVKRCIGVMESDPFATFELVKRVSRTHPARPGIREKPLVSVLIHNYNYGRYLRQCFESVVRQTYENIEVIFSDNCSSDESWEIAVEYAHTYPGWMTLTRNRKNFGPAANLANCYRFAHGKYFCILCSDDALRPDFVSRCVQVLEANPESGFAMTHRTILDENGTSADEPSFYNRSCVIPGPEQAAVYMMAAVNPSISQIMYSREKAFNHLPEDGVVSRWYAQRLLDFKLCCHHSMAYIKEPLLLHRVHSASDSSQIAMNVMEAFGQFILPHQFAEIAAGKDKLEKAIARLPDALEKLGRLCLRYSTRALCAHDEVCSLRYFHLSAAVFPGVLRDPVYNELSGYWAGDAAQKERTVARLRATDNLMTRTVSYDPPPGSLPIPSDTHGTA